MDFTEAFDEKRFSYQKIFLLRLPPFYFVACVGKCLCCCEYSAQDNVFLVVVVVVPSYFTV